MNSKFYFAPFAPLREKSLWIARCALLLHCFSDFIYATNALACSSLMPFSP